MCKKQLLFLALSTTMLFSSGCTPFSSSYPVTPTQNQEIVEIENPDYTYSYKTPDGEIVFANIPQLIFVNGFATIVENEKYGIVDKYGNRLVEPMLTTLSLVLKSSMSAKKQAFPPKNSQNKMSQTFFTPVLIR